MTAGHFHPIIIRSSGPNHPIPASPRLDTRSESTDNRPIFRGQSSDGAAEIVRNRQAKRPDRQISTMCEAANPVDFDGIGVPSQNGARTFLSAKGSGDFPVPGIPGWTDAKRRWRSKTRPPIIEAEARETDKALKEILEKIGV